jgi:signal transduction histidine kinase
VQGEDAMSERRVDDTVSILLVDDQPQRLLSYRAVLEDMGWDLVCARSAREALKLLMEREFAVVLLDVSMPEIDGFEAARLIRQHPRYERTPIIFVTGVRLDEPDRLTGYALGAVDYVSIPIVPEILRSKVSVLVELYCKRRELQVLNEDLARTNAQLAQANLTLQEERTREIEAVNDRLQEANADLESANSSLQRQIAERSRAELALKQADRHKDEFLAMLAHELRNPLAPIHNAVQLMHRSSITDPQLIWARELIARQVTHLTRLVDDLLDVSRITRGKINLEKEVVELGSLITRAIELVQPHLEERRHELTVDLPEPSLRVVGDPTRLTQAISNVLGNAVKYTDCGGRIAVSATKCEHDVEIRVRDNGIGIPPERLARVFEPFTQFDRGTNGSPGGLGIGLALVHRLVEMHGGRITAASEGRGRGSEFVIRLPLDRRSQRRRRAPEDPSAKRALESASAAASKGSVVRRILLADDNDDALESLAKLLELSGHEVFTATHGGTALQCAEQHRPQVALLDIGMPMLDGYEVARRIRAQPWGHRMMLVALTGWGQDADRQRAREAGFDSHLIKPPDLAQLNELLERLPGNP